MREEQSIVYNLVVGLANKRLGSTKYKKQTCKLRLTIFDTIRKFNAITYFANLNCGPRK
jgi:hypothetical protein